MKKILMILMTAALIQAPPASSSAGQPAEIIADVVLVRPLSLAATVVGTAFFIIALPFSVPSGSVNETARTLVADPFNYTFRRPIGDFGYAPYYASYVDTRSETSGRYADLNPPGNIIIQSQPPAAPETPPARLFVYPRQGQTAEQQRLDTDTCHRLAVDQAGYDPTLSPAGTSDAGRKADYQRTLSACLAERGYAVR